jgi:hypothetical protein
MKALKPFLFIVTLVLAVGLACAFGSTPEPTAVPPTDVPTALPEPTQAPEPTKEPEATATTESAPAASDFYREEFDGDTSNFTYFEFHEAFANKPTDKDIIPTTKDGYLVFDLKKPNKWVFVTYDPYKYTDVRLDLKADNRGKNNNNVGLICRYSDEGFYFFSIANNGLYWIWAYVNADGKFYLIVNGGSNLIKQGKDTNAYTAICNGNELTLGVNGTEVKTITDTKYKLRDGKVGFGVLSFDVTPILVEVDYFDISKP